MNLVKTKYAVAAMAIGLFSVNAYAEGGGHGHAAEGGPACEGFGPQTPRDIDSKKGENKRVFSMAPSYKEMNLCNIHMHNGAEHKAKAYSVSLGAGSPVHDGHGAIGGGFACGISKKLSQAELAPPSKEICKGLKPGDTVEFHWVHSSCDIKPGKGLGSCSSASCANPDLRVEAQVFTLVNDPKALQMKDMGYGGNMVNGMHQAKSIPSNTGKPVLFAGSTTGPKWTDQACSPLQVTWSVRPDCAKLDINSLGEWCAKNEFEEAEAHGVRKLVENTKLLSPIK